MTSTINRDSITNIPGRSSSQVSIYDYPEHLNPFYEDDNHKRLRFWKINKSSQKEKKGRSNSFSLNGLKDIWAFKSFNLKKRSSTLGINKTSESPPMLRHQMVVHPTYDTYNTVDSRVRHTVQIGLNNNNNHNNNNHHFPRGAGYRSSLQNVHSGGGSDTASTSGDIGFYRNDRYRSTVQPAAVGSGYSTIATPTKRYIHNGGSVTPTPRSRFGIMSHGSSQSSINSTNPFDDDDDDDNNNNNIDGDGDTISRITTIDGVQVRRPGRKKRRAPPPPVRSSTPLGSANACISEDVSSISEQSHTKSLNQEDMAEISNLTAEIESFVRTADTDKEKLRDSPEKSKKKKEKSPPPPAPSSSTSISPIKATTSTSTSTQPTVKTATITNTEQLTRIERTSPPKQMNTVVTTVVLTERRRSSADKQINNEQIQQLQYKANHTTAQQSTKEMSPDRVREERSSSQRSRVSPENNDEYPVTPERESSIEIDTLTTASTTTSTSTDTVVTNTATTTTTTSIIPLQKNNSEKQLNVIKNSPPKIFIRSATEDNDSIEQHPLPETPTSPTSPSPSINNYEKQHHEIVRTYEIPKPQMIDELRITESTDDLVNDKTTPVEPPPEESYKIRYVPLKNYTPEMERRSNSEFVTVPLRNGNNQTYKNEINQPNTNTNNNIIFDENGKKIPPAPPQRRRSVRDIIASINKSQSLLKINQRKSNNDSSSSSTTKRYNDAIDQQITEHYSNFKKLETPSTSSTPNDENVRRSTKEILASEKELRDVILNMENQENNNSTSNNSNYQQNHHHNQHPEDVKHIPVMVERFDEFKQDELFKKCVVRREKSSFMDWNPLPKPRRSRNFDA